MPSYQVKNRRNNIFIVTPAKKNFNSSSSHKDFTDHVKNRTTVAPLEQFRKLNMDEQELFHRMRRFIIDPSLLKVYGFPVESAYYDGCFEICKCLPKHMAEESITQDNKRHLRHFYGRKRLDLNSNSDGFYSSSYIQRWYARSHVNSEYCSCKSSSRSTEVSEEDLFLPVTAFYTPDGVFQIFGEYCNSIEKKCVRCSEKFLVNSQGEYLSFDSCTYHWGKLRYVNDGKCYLKMYTCCQGIEFSEGCSKHPLHVWNGLVVGLNGPYSGFLHTQQKKTNDREHSKIYAMDCEMSYTGLGLEVTKITVVGFDGALVYDHFVKPQAQIIDYNTRFSGVSEQDFLPNSNKCIKTFVEVQQDLLSLFDSNTILIGHALENDLKALRLVHKTIVDTSVIFKHPSGYPYRQSLKYLTKSLLKRDIQSEDLGHSGFEDSRACLDLIMWKIRKDLCPWTQQ